jgi:mRNA interferase RelE/StbE
VARRILDYMDRKISPLDNPRLHGKALRGPMGQLWRYRVGDCRVVCDLQAEVLTVLVVRVGHRKEVYRR